MRGPDSSANGVCDQLSAEGDRHFAVEAESCSNHHSQRKNSAYILAPPSPESPPKRLIPPLGLP